MSTADETETGAVATWLVAKIKTDVSLPAIFDSLAPQKQAPPFIIFSFQAITDINAVNGVTGATSLVCLVKAVTTGDSFQAGELISKKVKALLHRASGTVTGWKILECVREGSARYPEFAEGIRYNHVGGTYRIVIEAT